MIVFISDLHIGATVPLTKAGQQMRAQVEGRGEKLGPLKLQLTAGAVRGFYGDLTRLAKGANATAVTIVLLGDVFDFIQTRAWQDLQCGGHRPWVHGDPSEEQVLEVFGEIVDDEPINREFLEALRETDELHWQDANGKEHRTTVTRVYVPGNHDRLCNLHGSVRARVRAVLGITAPAGGTVQDEFVWEFDEPEHHHVFARHGHVFDANNYAGDAGFSKAGHERTPIGDLLTTQIASRLYGAMADRLGKSTRASAHQTYAQIVRALEAMFAASGALGPVGFLWKRLCRHWHGGAILMAAVRSLLRLGWGFSQRCCGPAWFGRGRCSNFAWALRTSLGLLALVPAAAALVALLLGAVWLHWQHAQTWLHGHWPYVAETVVLVAAVWALAFTLQSLRNRRLQTLGVVFLLALGAGLWRLWLNALHGPDGHVPVWGYVLGGVTLLTGVLWAPLAGALSTDKALRRGARREAADRKERLRFIVYGHTHNPLQELLTFNGQGEPLFYLNSGTWHQKVDAAADDSDFVSHKNMTYVVVYNDHEATEQQHAAEQYFETWTGTLHDHDCFRPDDLDESLRVFTAHAQAAPAQVDLPGDVSKPHDNPS